jgi:diguanylate cyclase
LKTTYKQKIYNLKEELRDLKKDLARKDRTIDAIKKEIKVDFLTKIMNRKGILNELAGMINMYSRNPINFTGVLFDVDDFKAVNNRGFVIGDKLLKHLARFVTKNLRKTDKFGRLGGDEFLILLPATSETSAFQLMDKIREKVRQHKFKFKEAKIKVTISGGIAEYRGSYSEPVGMLKQTDSGLRQAKKSGKNKFVKFSK